MPHGFLQLIVDPESSQVEAQHHRGSRYSPGRAELTAGTFDPRLIERVGHRLQHT